MSDAHAESPDAPRPRLWPRIVAVIVALVTTMLAPWWAPRALARLAYFRVRRVEIVGARFVQPSDILARLHVDALSSVWDPSQPLEDRIASHRGVRSVRVRRRLPGTLVVEITERWPDRKSTRLNSSHA